MFTGLIETTGTLRRVTPLGADKRFDIAASFDSLPVKGESIAVNGTCLTVEDPKEDGFTAFASAETLAVTSLAALKIGSKVNLERAMKADGRFGGHMVSGHVDALATVDNVTSVGESLIFRLAFPADLSAYVIEKGSIALDGISLTVNDCGEGFLTVNIIPETQDVTTIADWKTGTTVNMECDMVGKYVAAFLKRGYTSNMTMDFLKENGF